MVVEGEVVARVAAAVVGDTQEVRPEVVQAVRETQALEQAAPEAKAGLAQGRVPPELKVGAAQGRVPPELKVGAAQGRVPPEQKVEPLAGPREQEDAVSGLEEGVSTTPTSL